MIAPYNCVIMANGSFPQTAVSLNLLRQASVVIACDGVVAALDKAGITPTAIVGDLDSLPSRFRNMYSDRIHLVEDQEINDLTKSILFACRSGQQEVLIMGATGLREDHTLGNISLLMEHAALFRRIEMLSDYGLFTPLLKTSTLCSSPGMQVSLFSLSPSGTISTSGLRWPICNRQLTAWWQGTLNEATGNSFTVTLSMEARVLVYRTLGIPAKKTV
ncbi:thiamine diphosphokinase [Xylanibacter muris]|uniref:Thiamine diphosphokinase n=1 Tax=Xylanibacter muris TaxID=2736290 RepID=A0ABX2ARH7_9BACT|nr:thiamine diphosphokinase [Xylanibacter muris]NPD92819.1 thiamine diphosphokinase [Xylanibacter muris]